MSKLNALITGILVWSVVLSAPIAKAQTGELRDDIREIRTETRTTNKDTLEAVKTDVRTIRGSARTGSTTQEEAREEAKRRLEESREKMQGEREEAKRQILEKREQMKTEAEKIRAAHLLKLSEMYTKRYVAAYERLVDIKERIVKHIEKLDARGVSTLEAKAELDKATPILAEALASIEAFETALLALNVDPTNETLRADAKAKGETAKTDLKEAHAALVKVITTLKPGRNTEKASTTPSSN